MAASTKDMSAHQAQHAPVRLLIAERSENAAYQFDSLVRDAGIATRPEIIDLPMAIDKLAHADMMLCNAALPELNQLLRCPKKTLTVWLGSGRISLSRLRLPGNESLCLTNLHVYL